MKNKTTACAFVIMIAAFIVMLLLPADRDSITAENRSMSTMPPINAETAFSGEFAQGVEGVIGDNIGYRAALTEFSKKLGSAKGFLLRDGQIISTNKDIGTGTVQKQTLLAADNKIMEMFIKNTAQETMYAEAVNSIVWNLPDNIKVFSMLVPTQLEFCEPIYKNLQDSQKDAINSIYSKLDSRITAVDAYGALERHTDEYIYFRTDHHWTQLGAYYAYSEFMDSGGSAAVSKDDFDINSIRRFLGSLSDRVNLSEVSAPPDTIEWYDVDKNNSVTVRMHDISENGELTDYNGVMYERTKTDYTFFFGSDHPVVEMTNADNPDGKTLIILKESYCNALAPWLIKNYRSVILVDPRIYRGRLDTLINEFTPDEMLIINYIFTTNFSDYCLLLKNMY
ncbi:MAG: hypothetical protein HFE49_07950 [Clostridia bacterium]|nr:hypothetical protein [Clostridia bacterium]